jgi:hypothetical protein
MLAPAIHSVATAVIRSEDSRRFTITAIAIKRYHLANGQFPERLADLKAIGLNPSDWTTVAGTDFGYTPGDTPGDTVYVWSYSLRDPAVIAAERPEVDEDGMEQIVTIR